MGIFKLHRFNGIEEYHIAEAKIYAIMDSENKIKATSAPVRASVRPPAARGRRSASGRR